MRSISRVFLIVAALAVVACGGDQPPQEDEGGQSGQQGAGGETASVGRDRYQQVCVTCHQPEGQGTPGLYPPLAGADHVNGDPRLPIAIVLNGLYGPVTVKGELYNSVMQPWGMIPDAEIAAILTYVRSSWGNNGSAITADQVTAIRSAYPGRGAWTIEELRAEFPPQ